MSYSACDFVDDVFQALNVASDSPYFDEAAGLALAEIVRLQLIEAQWRQATRYSADPEGDDDANES